MDRQPTIPDYDTQRVAQANPQPKSRTKDDYKGYNPLFLNRFQRLVYSTGGRTTVCASGRATGKTSLLGLHQIRLYQSIPRGCTLFGAPSLKSLFTKTQPAMVKSMEQICGHIEGVHYYRGQPPKKLNWPRPLALPRDFSNVMYSYTGHITHFVSALSVAAGNGYNLTSIILDEARYVRNFQQNYIESILPALRGEMYDNPGWNKDSNYLYLSQFVMSDNGVVQSQREFYNHYKKLVTPDINRKIAEMIAELQVCPELENLPGFMKQLNMLRADATTLYTCASAYNEGLPESFLRDMKLQLPPILFSVQIMGNDLDDGIDNDQYYYCFNPEVHLYDQNEWAEKSRILGDSLRKKTHKDGYGITLEWVSPDLDVTASHAEDDYYDVDIDPKYPLCLSFDLNANFNTVVVSQRIPHGARMEIRIVNCLFTKYKEKLRALLGKFMAYYAHRKSVNRHLKLLFDATLKQGQSYALEDIESSRYTEVIRDVLTKNGWECEIENLGTPMAHDQKFQFLNDLLAGQMAYDVRINKELDFLIAAIGACKVIDTRRGPAKDKSKEKLKSESDDSEGQALERRTDVTDALDVSLWAAVKSVGGYSPRGTNGVYFIQPTILI